ncbi:glycosyltransferase family 4 protein [Pectobacterium brasiliense]|uniref:glycosyltransferase family 4 protein n=1 Tax=Pectobacterium brasiliense TaxID=180957 RepID=UPI003988711A
MTTKITVLGTRGIPNVLGGVETHCQNLYPTIKQQFDVDICVLARSPYVNYKKSQYRGVMTRALLSPKKRSLEAIVHSVLAAFITCFDQSTVVHVHAIGPGLVVPLLRLLGKKVVFTHHGPDYDRHKWGFLAKKVLLLGEKVAVKYANEVIVISEVINNMIKQKYGRDDAHLIYNGVNLPQRLTADVIHQTLVRFSLQPQHYLVAVGRFVEEKGLHDLIAAYRKSGVTMPLVLVGDADHPTAYSMRLKQLAHETPNVILTGFLTGQELQTVFSQAKLFVMSSYHEGLPIALLEAMSFSLPVVVSNIPANLEVKLAPETYFNVGDVADLSEKITLRSKSLSVDYSEYLQRYNWQHIAEKTMTVYTAVNKSIG